MSQMFLHPYPTPICCVVISIFRRNPLVCKVNFGCKRLQCILFGGAGCEGRWTQKGRQRESCWNRSSPVHVRLSSWMELSTSTNTVTETFSMGNFSLFYNVFLKECSHFKFDVFRHTCNQEIPMMQDIQF